jgi:hypothetical protein
MPFIPSCQTDLYIYFFLYHPKILSAVPQLCWVTQTTSASTHPERDVNDATSSLSFLSLPRQQDRLREERKYDMLCLVGTTDVKVAQHS